MSSRNRLITLAFLVVLGIGAAVAALLGGSGSGSPTAAKSPSARASWVPTSQALADVCRSRLPAQAQDTLGLITKGGPYPYRSDGIVFENRESRLPRQNKGYYHEFTVVTPGSDDRGTRRIVTGSAGEQYWTADHYATFQEIDARC
ncbi:ribonuclease [Kitasatospora sp. NPDC049285]|uniref:ribonuclease n=1 Tax=Kitasatospora sp. NPDC049285 TaxID=3157096 RepID=UPI003430B8E8